MTQKVNRCLVFLTKYNQLIEDENAATDKTNKNECLLKYYKDINVNGLCLS